jgi:hypothetical protein
MSDRRWEQIGAAGGIVFILLQSVGQGLIQVGGSEPAFSAPAGEILSFFENRDQLLFNAGGYLSAVAFIAFFWFLGVLWARLRRYEGEPAWLSLVAVACGLVGSAVVLASSGWGAAVFRIDEGLDPGLARYLFDDGNIGFATYWVFLAGLLFTAGIVALRHGALPRWLAWLGLIGALALLIGRAVWDLESGIIFVPYIMAWIWIIAASIILIRDAGKGVPQ